MMNELTCDHNAMRYEVTAKKVENRHEPLAVEKARRLQRKTRETEKSKEPLCS